MAIATTHDRGGHPRRALRRWPSHSSLGSPSNTMLGNTHVATRVSSTAGRRSTTTPTEPETHLSIEAPGPGPVEVRVHVVLGGHASIVRCRCWGAGQLVGYVETTDHASRARLYARAGGWSLVVESARRDRYANTPECVDRNVYESRSHPWFWPASMRWRHVSRATTLEGEVDGTVIDSAQVGSVYGF